jgi:hypothetical protein
VPDRLLFVPINLVTAKSCDQVPAIRTALRDLSLHFSVEVYDSPLRKGATVQPRCSDMAIALRAALTPGCHLVVMGAEVPVALLALDGVTDVQSFTAAGFSAPTATLRSLGMRALADSSMAMWSNTLTGSYQYLRAVMEGASDDEVARLSHVLDDELDRSRHATFLESIQDLDLVAENPRVEVPTLFLDSTLPVAGFAEMSDVFRQFVPHAALGTLDIWPRRLHQESTGLDLSRKVVSFIQQGAKR